ncbi:LORF2 protein, partial [Crocuta crocuta]
LVKPLWKIVKRFLKMLKIKIPYDPIILLLTSVYPTDKIDVEQIKAVSPCLFIFLIVSFEKQKAYTKCPSTDKWIKKMWFIYTMRYYMAMRKNEIWPCVATWMDLEGVMLRE